VFVFVGFPPAVAVRVAVADGVTVTGITVSVALAGVEFVTPFPVIKALAGIVLIMLPGVLEVTLIATVQEPGVDPACAGTLPPVNVKLVPPDTAVTVPPHELDRPAGFAIVIPAGKLSVNAAFVNANGFGLKIDTLNREMPPDGMLIGEKLLLISAGTLTTPVAVIVGDGVNVIVGG
jgi:hypothetical protein